MEDHEKKLKEKENEIMKLDGEFTKKKQRLYRVNKKRKIEMANLNKELHQIREKTGAKIDSNLQGARKSYA